MKRYTSKLKFESSLLIIALALILLLPLELFAQRASTKNNSSQKVSWAAHILRQKEVPQLTGLSFFSKNVPVVLAAKNEELRPLIELKYEYNRPDWKIAVQGAPGKPFNIEKNIYVLHAFLNSQINEIVFSATGPNGEKEQEVVYIFAPEAQEFQIVSTWTSLVGYLGIANLIYEQTGFGVLNTKSMALGLNYATLDSSSLFGFLANAQMTVATFQSEPVAANPQLIEARLAGTIRLPLSEQTRWRHKASLGANHLSLLSNGSPFGFSALIAPELGFISQYYKNTRVSYISELRIVFLKNANFKNQRGLHGTFTLAETLKSGRKQDIFLRLSTTDYEEAKQRLAVHFFSLNLGYSF